MQKDPFAVLQSWKCCMHEDLQMVEMLCAAADGYLFRVCVDDCAIPSWCAASWAHSAICLHHAHPAGKHKCFILIQGHLLGNKRV